MLSRTKAIYLLDQAFDALNIRHFDASEFLFEGRLVPPLPLLYHIVPTVRILEDARLELGAIHISSAYRDPVTNKAEGGGKASQHLRFTAADAHPLEVPAAVLWDFLINHTHANRLGLGQYDDFAHIDCRHWVGMPQYGIGPARWDNRT
jgi:hypothetical protein